MSYRKHLLAMTILASLSAQAQSTIPNNSVPQKKTLQEASTLDPYNAAMKKAYEKLGLIKNYGKPRVVTRGAIPELIISGSEIRINGRPVSLGDSMSKWKQSLPGEARCIVSDEDMNCNWDHLGIYLLSFRGIVFQVCILLVREPWDTTQIELPGLTLPPLVDWQPKHAFQGYLELDGFGIDSKTKFWEVRSGANRSRDLRCGLYDCSFPGGAFGKDGASISFDLHRHDEYGTVKSMTIATGKETYIPKPRVRKE